MSRRESAIHPSFLWKAADVQRLPLSLKRVLDYCYTGPDVNVAGITEVEEIVWQTRIGETGLAIISSLQILEERSFVLFEEGTCEVFPMRWFSFNKFNRGLIVSMLKRDVQNIQSEKIKQQVLKLIIANGIELEKVQSAPKTALEDAENSGFEENQLLSSPTATATAKSTLKAEAASAAALAASQPTDAAASAAALCLTDETPAAAHPQLEARFTAMLREGQKAAGQKWDQGRDEANVIDCRRLAAKLPLSAALEALDGVRYASQGLKALQAAQKQQQVVAGQLRTEQLRLASHAAMGVQKTGKTVDCSGKWSKIPVAQMIQMTKQQSNRERPNA